MNDPSTYDQDQIQWQEARWHFNEVVIVMLEIYRLVGYCEDDHDVYYVLKQTNNPQHRRYMAFTGVGRPMWLKGNISEDDYNELDRQLTLNGVTPEPEFVLGFPKNYKY